MTEALVGLLGMLVLAFLRLPIALAMGLVGVIGYAYMRDWSWSAALAAVQTKVYETGRNYTLSVIPLFILMGSFVTRATDGRSITLGFAPGNPTSTRVASAVAMKAPAAEWP